MTYVDHAAGQCRNCGCYHRTRTGMYSSDCIMLSYRSHKNHKQPHWQRFTQSELTLQPLPLEIREQAKLFDDIWFDFVDVKQKIDHQREQLALRYRHKGSLKVKAPLLWLHWRRWDGAQGQTRNQENWEQLWKTFVSRPCEDDAGNKWRQPVAWLTIVRHVDQTRGAPLSPTLSTTSSHSSNSISSPILLNVPMNRDESSVLQWSNFWRNFAVEFKSAPTHPCSEHTFHKDSHTGFCWPG